ALRLCMLQCCCDVLFGRINSRDIGAQTRQRLRNQSTTAADVQNVQSGQWLDGLLGPVEVANEVIADKRKSRRPQLVQWPKFAVRVPPLPCQTGKAVDFFLIYSALLQTGGAHGKDLASFLRPMSSLQRFGCSP